MHEPQTWTLRIRTFGLTRLQGRRYLGISRRFTSSGDVDLGKLSVRRLAAGFRGVMVGLDMACREGDSDDDHAGLLIRAQEIFAELVRRQPFAGDYVVVREDEEP